MGRKTTALIVEDEPSIRRLLEVILGSRGYRTVGLGRGAEAVAVARREGADVVILDHGLPDVDGLVVLGELKSDPEVREIPVVVVTGWLDDDLEQTALEAGAYGAVAKPFQGDVLADLIDEAVIRHRRGDLTRTRSQ